MVIRLLALMGCTLLATALAAQSSISCCSSNATEAFASLGNDEAFINQHIEPSELAGFQASGTEIRYAVPNDEDGSAYFLPSKSQTDNWLVVIHEWWGLNSHIKQQAQDLQDSLVNVNVLCLDLYDGKSTSNRQEASALMSEADEKRIRGLIQGGLAFMGSDANVAFVGWCFGGGWSLQAAIMAGDQASACVIYYGMPEKNLRTLQKLEAPVLGIFAREDKWITPKVVEDFEVNMVEALKSLETVTFDADHAFANPSNPQYDEEASDQAMRMSIAFISEQWNN